MLPVFLLSNSPRRQELLRKVVTSFQIIKPVFSEASTIKANPLDLVKENTIGKNLFIDSTQVLSSCCLISSDTIVVYEKMILGKPLNQEEACRFLYLLSGNTHEVISGVSIRIIQKENQVHTYFYVRTTVSFHLISSDAIQEYVKTMNPIDKAGAYGIQEIPIEWVERIQGDVTNVIGLPVQRLAEELTWLNRYFPLPLCTQ